MYLVNPKYKHDSSETKSVRNWHVVVKDHLQRELRLSATTDKRTSAEFGRKIEHLVALRIADMALDENMTRFVAGLPAKVRDRLRQKGVLVGAAASVGQSVTDELLTFHAHLLAKGTSGTHANLVVNRARRALEPWTRWTDITTDGLQAHLFDLKTREKLSHQTFNFYVSAVNQFGRWLLRNRRAAENPAELMTKLNVAIDRRHDRRALSLEEIGKLLLAAQSGKTRCGITGPERSLFYRLALETGLRSREIRSLTVGSFELKSKHPSVQVSAAYAKGGRTDRMPIPRALANSLASYFGERDAAERALPLPSVNAVTRYLKLDLKAAGVPYRSAKGEFADLHALRHSYITNLSNAGVPAKAVQKLARHSTIRLTMDRYAHVDDRSLQEAVAALPDLLGKSDNVANEPPKNGLQPGLQETGAAAGFCVTPYAENETPDEKITKAPHRPRKCSESTKTGLQQGPQAGDDWRWRRDSNPRMTVLQTVA